MYSWTVELDGTPRGDHRRAVAVGLKVYSIGGYINMHGRMTIDVRVFNTVSLRWTTLPPVTTSRGQCPPDVPFRYWRHAPVLIHHMVFIPVIFHEQDENHFVLYALDVETHRLFQPEVSGDVPPVTIRKYNSLFSVVSGQVMYVWLTGYDSGEMCRLDTATMVWSSINTRGTPAPISLARNFANIIGTKIYLVGDRGNSMRAEESYVNGSEDWPMFFLSVFDVETNLWLGQPFALDYKAIGWPRCVTAYNGELYMLAKRAPPSTEQVWKFNPETFSWRTVRPRGNDPCTGLRMCCRVVGCCVVGECIVFFGGPEDKEFADKLHILDMSPSLKALCKPLVIQYGLEQSGLPHDLRWELAAMTTQEEEGEEFDSFVQQCYASDPKYKPCLYYRKK